MGEYVKHPSMLDEEEIKIGVCRGDDWETYLSKAILQELDRLGFQGWYGGGFNGTSLGDFINQYERLNTEFIRYTQVGFREIEVADSEFEAYKQILLDENIGLVFFRDGKKVLVSDVEYLEELVRHAESRGLQGMTVKPYEFLVTPLLVPVGMANDRLEQANQVSGRRLHGVLTTTQVNLVIVESPFAGNVEENIHYARMAVRDSLLRGEAPIASHLLYTQDGILNDNIPEERQQGIDAGLAWGSVAQKSVIYIDKGITLGMEYGIQRAIQDGRAIEFRSLPDFVGELTVSECEEKYLIK